MKAIKYIPIIIGILLGLYGCEKEIPFDSEVIESKLVINSLFTSDSVWAVHISRSRSVIDTSSLTNIDDADVRIYDASNNLAAVLHHQTDGLYKANTEKPLPNETYRIEVSAPGYKSVHATNAIPGTVQIINIDTNTVIEPDSTQLLEVSITFQDPAGIENYYMIDMTGEFVYFDGIDSIEYSYLMEIQCNDPNIETSNSFNVDGFENYYDYLLLKDNAFEGQEYTIQFSVRNWEIEKDLEISALLSLISSSEEFFNYRRSYAAYYYSYGDPFSQPVQVFSNVEGGMGIFAGGSRSIWNIDF